MIHRTVFLNAIEPALLSLRCPLGVDLDLGLSFIRQDSSQVDADTLLPQLALLPRSATGIFSRDVDSTGRVSIPGPALLDVNGYNLELYQRRPAVLPNNPPVPIGLLAKGVLRLEGSAYVSRGPLSPVTFPTVVGPPGPQGPQGGQGEQGLQGKQGIQGETGKRGSVWTTGSGAPEVTGSEFSGDMYLDESNGDVWRFDGEAWQRGAF